MSQVKEKIDPLLKEVRCVIPNPNPNTRLDGGDDGCYIVAVTEKPKRPYPEPSVLLRHPRLKLILSIPKTRPYAKL